MTTWTARSTLGPDNHDHQETTRRTQETRSHQETTIRTPEDEQEDTRTTTRQNRSLQCIWVDSNMTVMLPPVYELQKILKAKMRPMF